MTVWWHPVSWAYQAAATRGSNYQKAQQPVWSRCQAWEGHPSTSSSSAPDRHLSDIFLIALQHVPRVAQDASDWIRLLLQRLPTCWSVEMCYQSRSFWGHVLTQTVKMINTRWWRLTDHPREGPLLRECQVTSYFTYCSGVRRGGGVGGPNPHWTYINFSQISSYRYHRLILKKIRKAHSYSWTCSSLSSWNDCCRQFNCRHHAVINDIST